MSTPLRSAADAGPTPRIPPRRSAEPRPLRPVSGRPPLGVYLQQLWERRHFIGERAWSLAVTQNRGLLLGNLWLVLNPLMDAAIYMVIFGFLFASNIPNFPAYLVIGIFMFGITSRDVTSAASVMAANRGLMRAFSFPRAALPLASLVRNMIESVPSIVVMALLTIPFVGLPGAAVLLFPALYALQVLFNAGLVFAAARLCSMVPDFKKVIPVFFRFMLYGSAIMFSIDRYDAIPWLARIIRHNPLFLLVDGYRQLLLFDQVPPASHWLELSAWAVGVLVLGFVWFWRGEVTYGRPE